jgi:hypothetical protein
MMPSILISTLERRREQFAHIFDGLRAQARARNLDAEVEIIFLRDNKEHSLGFKRNQLGAAS